MLQYDGMLVFLSGTRQQTHIKVNKYINRDKMAFTREDEGAYEELSSLIQHLFVLSQFIFMKI